MDKEQKEIELKKLEIEKLKLLESYFKTLAFIILTIGAGLGTLLRLLYPNIFTIKFLLVILLTVFIVFVIPFVMVWIKLQKYLKRF